MAAFSEHRDPLCFQWMVFQPLSTFGWGPWTSSASFKLWSAEFVVFCLFYFLLSSLSPSSFFVSQNQGPNSFKINIVEERSSSPTTFQFECMHYFPFLVSNENFHVNPLFPLFAKSLASTQLQAKMPIVIFSAEVGESTLERVARVGPGLFPITPHLCCNICITPSLKKT